LTFQIENTVATVELGFDGNRCQFVHPITIKAFQTAAAESWQAGTAPTRSTDRATREAMLTVITPQSTRQWPVIMMERKPGGGEYVPVKIGPTWVRDDSLLGRLIATFEATRQLPWQDPWTVNDSRIPGGFTQQELDQIASDTVNKIAAENRDWKPAPPTKVSAGSGSCCGEKPTKTATAGPAASCGGGGGKGGCTCGSGSSCGTSVEPAKPEQVPK
jgi:hypothetical protein